MEKQANTKKDFGYIWDIIDMPVLILVLYSLLELSFSITKYVSKVIPPTFFGFLLSIFAFGLIGYRTIKKKENSTKAAKYGAYAGLIIGFISAIIGIITYYFFPEKIAESIQTAVQAGADASTVNQFIRIGLFANFILSPALNAGIGALIAWVSGAVFNSNKKR